MPYGLGVPLLCVLAYVAWTIGLVVALTVARLRHLRGGGSVRDFGVPDDRRLIWRLFRAHANAVENLAVFAALILAAQVLNISTPLTALAGSLYLWSRVAHAVTYTFGVPWLRTLAFVGGFVAQMLVAWQLLGA